MPIIANKDVTQTFWGYQLDTMGRCSLKTKVNESKSSTPVLCAPGISETSPGFKMMLRARLN